MAEDGFLQRWSRRKASQGPRVPDGPPKSPAAQPPVATPAIGRVQAPDAMLSKSGQQPPHTPPAALDPAPGSAQPSKPDTEHQPPPSLADTQALTPASDFRPFMGRGVAPEVKNAAMKKLFADPHFNVMDRMDIYIDDYSQADPLPLAMLRQMNGAKFLNLFEDEDKDKGKDPAALAPAPAEGAMQSPVSPAGDSVALTASAPTPPIAAPLCADAPHGPDVGAAPEASPPLTGDATGAVRTLPAPKA